MLVGALQPLHDVLLQTSAIALGTVCGHTAYLPVMIITSFPGRANPAWLTVLRLLQNHAKLVKGMGETTIGKLRDAAAGAAALGGCDGSLHGSGGLRDSGRGEVGQSVGNGVGKERGSGKGLEGHEEDIITWADVSVTYLPSMMEVLVLFVCGLPCCLRTFLRMCCW